MLLSFTPASPCSGDADETFRCSCLAALELAADLRRIVEASTSSSEARPLRFRCGLHGNYATTVPLRLAGPLISIRSDCARERVATKRPTHLAEDDSATHSAKSTTLRTPVSSCI